MNNILSRVIGGDSPEHFRGHLAGLVQKRTAAGEQRRRGEELLNAHAIGKVAGDAAAQREYNSGMALVVRADGEIGPLDKAIEDTKRLLAESETKAAAAEWRRKIGELRRADTARLDLAGEIDSDLAALADKLERFDRMTEARVALADELRPPPVRGAVAALSPSSWRARLHARFLAVGLERFFHIRNAWTQDAGYRLRQAEAEAQRLHENEIPAVPPANSERLPPAA